LRRYDLRVVAQGFGQKILEIRPIWLRPQPGGEEWHEQKRPAH
jgi:hypothetical protein